MLDKALLEVLRVFKPPLMMALQKFKLLLKMLEKALLKVLRVFEQLLQTLEKALLKVFKTLKLLLKPCGQKGNHLEIKCNN